MLLLQRDGRSRIVASFDVDRAIDLGEQRLPLEGQNLRLVVQTSCCLPHNRRIVIACRSLQIKEHAIGRIKHLLAQLRPSVGIEHQGLSLLQIADADTGFGIGMYHCRGIGIARRDCKVSVPGLLNERVGARHLEFLPSASSVGDGAVTTITD